MELSGGRSGCGILQLSLIRCCWHFFSCFSLVFSFGRDCAVCPSDELHVVSGGCYINIAGRKPVSRTPLS